MLYTFSDSKQVKRESFTAFLYNQKKNYDKMNAVYVDCKKSHERVYVKSSHRVYFVIHGEGVFNVGTKEYKVREKDVIVIEPKTEYSYRGKMKLFEINFLATDKNDEVRVG